MNMLKVYGMIAFQFDVCIILFFFIDYSFLNLRFWLINFLNHFLDSPDANDY